jgi:hypothetical protein
MQLASAGGPGVRPIHESMMKSENLLKIKS